MAAAIGKPQPKPAETFVESNFAPLAFTASALTLIALRALSFLLGVAAGIAIHHYQWIQAKKDPEGRLIPISSATYAIVGAVAALIGSGGLIFNSIPLLASATIGMTLYRAVKL